MLNFLWWNFMKSSPVLTEIILKVEVGKKAGEGCADLCSIDKDCIGLSLYLYRRRKGYLIIETSTRIEEYTHNYVLYCTLNKFLFLRIFCYAWDIASETSSWSIATAFFKILYRFQLYP